MRPPHLLPPMRAAPTKTPTLSTSLEQLIYSPRPLIGHLSETREPTDALKPRPFSKHFFLFWLRRYVRAPYYLKKKC